ncbi:MAG: RAMP superfamily CRISPR-associated protein [Syntrophobacteraceae bacterium]|jgi:hypothetical protein
MRKSELAPKPFDIVPFESKPELRALTGHDRFGDASSGKAVFEIKTLTPLHIGSGIWTVEKGEVVREFIEVNGKRVIPGSSLKGVFRMVAETISRSCVCKTSAKRLSINGLRECEVKDGKGKLCPTCSLFGAMGFKGRVHFTDSILKSGKTGIRNIPPLYGPRPDSRIYKDTTGQYRGRKFYFHGEPSRGKEPVRVIEAGSVWECEMGFENLSEHELGLMLVSVGAIGGLIPKMGGAKPVCFGSFRVKAVRLEIRQMTQDLVSYSAKPEVLESQSLASYLDTIWRADNPLILTNSFQRLKTIWNYPTVRKCPFAMY